MNTLVLHIPGLLAVPARLLDAVSLPHAPALAEWCDRGSEEEVAAGRFGLVAEQLGTSAPPIAALAWFGATGEKPPANVVLATPVHLVAGLDDLVLVAGPQLDVTAEERALLAKDLAAFFGDAPRVCVHGEHLFLVLPDDMPVRTTPLHRAQGQRIGRLLPQGDARLNAWLNELQMFLHGHAINRARAEAGKPAINGVWPWGEGALPAPDASACTFHPATSVMRGVGLLRGRVNDDSALHDVLQQDGQHVIDVPDCVAALDADDAAGWQQAVARIDEEVLAAAMAWVGAASGRDAVLYAGDGVARRLHGRKGPWQMIVERFRTSPPPVVREEH